MTDELKGGSVFLLTPHVLVTITLGVSRIAGGPSVSVAVQMI
jgi:hypothetical protein